LTGLNAGTASLKEADIAGTSAHTIFGEKLLFEKLNVG